MLADMTFLAQGFEAVMLICFGLSWPIAVLKTWRTGRTEGISVFFLALVFVGYLAGITMKCLRWQGGASLEPVTALYAINACLVATHIMLVVRLRRTPRD